MDLGRFDPNRAFRLPVCANADPLYNWPSMSTLWNAANYDAAHGHVWTMAAGLIDLLDPKAGERVVDLGSGTGHLAAEIARRGAGVIGLDASADMVRRAAANYPHLAFQVGDATTFAVADPVDAVFSNATLHWVTGADAAAARVLAA
jgi:trans-aconitate methyltransferase